MDRTGWLMSRLIHRLSQYQMPNRDEPAFVEFSCLGTDGRAFLEGRNTSKLHAHKIGLLCYNAIE